MFYADTIQKHFHKINSIIYSYFFSEKEEEPDKEQKLRGQKLSSLRSQRECCSKKGKFFTISGAKERYWRIRTGFRD